jgi:hypothetical protein
MAAPLGSVTKPVRLAVLTWARVTVVTGNKKITSETRIRFISPPHAPATVAPADRQKSGVSLLQLSIEANPMVLPVSTGILNVIRTGMFSLASPRTLNGDRERAKQRSAWLHRAAGRRPCWLATSIPYLADAGANLDIANWRGQTRLRLAQDDHMLPTAKRGYLPATDIVGSVTRNLNGYLDEARISSAARTLDRRRVHNQSSPLTFCSLSRMQALSILER